MVVALFGTVKVSMLGLMRIIQISSLKMVELFDDDDGF
jgi:hypothetical protein